MTDKGMTRELAEAVADIIIQTKKIGDIAQDTQQLDNAMAALIAGFLATYCASLQCDYRLEPEQCGQRALVLLRDAAQATVEVSQEMSSDRKQSIKN